MCSHQCGSTSPWRKLLFKEKILPNHKLQENSCSPWSSQHDGKPALMQLHLHVLLLWEIKWIQC